MPKKKHTQESLAFRFVFRHWTDHGPLFSHATLWSTGTSATTLIASSRTMRSAVESLFASESYSYQPVGIVTIMGSCEGRGDPGVILDAIERRLDSNECAFDESPVIELIRIRVSARTFRRLIEYWPCVTFVACEFCDGWWRGDQPAAKCETLHFIGCTFPPGTPDRLGCATFESLTSLRFDDVERGCADRRDIAWSTQSHDARATLRALYRSSLADLHICGAETCRAIAALPTLDRLRSLTLFGSELDASLLDWIVSSRKVRDLSIEFKHIGDIDWTRLNRLRHLGSLDLSYMRIEDAPLAEILQSTRIRHLDLMRTNVTAASWPALLSHPTLKSVDVSGSIFDDPWPEDLPATTQLRQVAVFNQGRHEARRMFTEFARYPLLKTWSDSPWTFSNVESLNTRSIMMVTSRLRIGHITLANESDTS